MQNLSRAGEPDAAAGFHRPERRADARRGVLERGELVVVDMGPLGTGLLLDLSGKGVSIQATKPLTPGLQGVAWFRLPESRVSIQPTYEVVWSDSDGKAGLKFLQVPDQDRRQLLQWLSAHPVEAAALPTVSAAEAQASSPAFAKSGHPVSPAPAAEAAEASVRDLAGTEPELLAFEREMAASGLDEALPRLVQEACSRARADGAAIALCDEQGIVCRASTGNAPDVGVRLNPNSGLSGECIRTGKVISCTDALTDSRVPPAVIQYMKLRSVLVAPVCVRDSTVGFVEVLSSQPSHFSATDVASVECVARVLSSLLAASPEGKRRAANISPRPEPQEQKWVTGILELLEPELQKPSEAGEQALAFQIEAIPESPQQPLPVVQEGFMQTATLATGESAEEVFEPPPDVSGLLGELEPKPTFWSRAGPYAFAASLLAVVAVAGWIAATGRWPYGTATPSAHTTAVETASPQATTGGRAEVAPTPAAADAPTPLKTSESASLPRSEQRSPGPAKSVVPLTPMPPTQASSTAIGRPAPPGAMPTADSKTRQVPSAVNAATNGSAQPPALVMQPPSQLPAAVLPVVPPATARLAPATTSPAPPAYVSGEALQGYVISQPQPVYPEHARRARIRGAVVLEAVIGADGTVKGIRVLNGDPVLANAAVSAVSKWRYRPYLQNGQAVDVMTTITLNFPPGRQ